MIETSEKLAELVESSGPSQEPDYLHWKEGKIKAALDALERNPQDRIPQHEVWRKFGL